MVAEKGEKISLNYFHFFLVSVNYLITFAAPYGKRILKTEKGVNLSSEKK